MAVPCIHDIFCRLAPAAAAGAAAAANPYLQQMYAAAAAASNPYAQLQGTGLISLAQAQNPLVAAATTPTAAASATAGSTGNPLMDAYGQYAALMAANAVYTTTAGATQQQLTASQAIDAQASKLKFGVFFSFFLILFFVNVGCKQMPTSLFDFKQHVLSQN